LNSDTRRVATPKRLSKTLIEDQEKNADNSMDGGGRAPQDIVFFCNTNISIQHHAHIADDMVIFFLSKSS